MDFLFSAHASEAELASFLLVGGSGFILRPAFSSSGGPTPFMRTVELQAPASSASATPPAPRNENTSSSVQVQELLARSARTLHSSPNKSLKSSQKTKTMATATPVRSSSSSDFLRFQEEGHDDDIFREDEDDENSRPEPSGGCEECDGRDVDTDEDRSLAVEASAGDVATECAYLTLWRADMLAIARSQHTYLLRRAQLTST